MAGPSIPSQIGQAVSLSAREWQSVCYCSKVRCGERSSRHIAPWHITSPSRYHIASAAIPVGVDYSAGESSATSQPREIDPADMCGTCGTCRTIGTGRKYSTGRAKAQ